MSHQSVTLHIVYSISRKTHQETQLTISRQEREEAVDLLG